MPLADFVTYHDAIAKMRFAKQNRDETGQPFPCAKGRSRSLRHGRLWPLDAQ